MSQTALQCSGMSPAGWECWRGVLACFPEICPVGFSLWIKGEGNRQCHGGAGSVCRAKRHKAGGGKAAGLPGAAQRCRGIACMGGCCKAGGVGAAPCWGCFEWRGTDGDRTSDDAERCGAGGHRMEPGCPALHRTAGGAAAGDRAALQHFAGQGDAQRCTGPGEGECGIAGAGAAPRRVLAWDEDSRRYTLRESAAGVEVPTGADGPGGGCSVPGEGTVTVPGAARLTCRPAASALCRSSSSCSCLSKDW